MTRQIDVINGAHEAWIAAYWYARGRGDDPDNADEFAKSHRDAVRKALETDLNTPAIETSYVAFT